MSMRRGMRRLAVVASALYLALLVDWTSLRHPAPPRLLRSFDVSSRLRAGAMKVRLQPPFPLMRPSGRYPRVMAEREQDPLMVRAMVLRSGGKTLAIVLADLMVISDELDRALEIRLADLHLDGVVLVATHTHG
jgi:neutral ceramidase